MRDGRLVMLYPRRKVTVADKARAGDKRQNLDAKTLEREAIAWYEAASLAFARERYRDEDREATSERKRF